MKSLLISDMNKQPLVITKRARALVESICCEWRRYLLVTHRHGRPRRPLSPAVVSTLTVSYPHLPPPPPLVALSRMLSSVQSKCPGLAQGVLVDGGGPYRGVPVHQCHATGLGSTPQNVRAGCACVSPCWAVVVPLPTRRRREF
jgi:hypothetical protein